MELNFPNCKHCGKPQGKHLATTGACPVRSSALGGIRYHKANRYSPAKARSPLCAKCRKAKDNHKAGTFNCPMGLAHRTLGYTQFHADQFWTPRQ